MNARAPDRFDRYLAVTKWAADRYRRSDGSLVLFVGGRLSAYTRIERAAAERYLGIAPRKTTESRA